MKFLKIKLKNFLSFGNSFTEINLDTNKLVLMKGKNAHGKSTIMEAVFFAFTGKPYRNITKPRLVNNINKKNLMVELDLEHLGSAYKIKRGIKPNLFEIYKDGELVNEDSHIKDYQRQLENMLGMDSKTFKQTIMISSRYYTPFLDLKPQEKREFIENIFSIKIFSDMNDHLKKQIQIIKQQIKESELNIKNSESNIKLLEDINKKQQNQMKKQKENINYKISTLEEDNIEIQDEISNNQEEISKLNKQITGLNDKISQKTEIFKKIDITNYKIEQNEERINFFMDNSICESCEQEIDTELANNKIKEKQEEQNIKKNYLNKLEQATDNIKKIESKITELKNKINDFQSKNIGLKNKINNNKQNILEYKKDFNEIEKEDTVENSDIKKYYDEKNKLEKEYNKRKKYKDYLVKTVELISEKGIKKYIIDKYIPILNQSLNQYLKKFNAPYSIMFNSEMEETIIARGYEDLGYSNLSSGEKQRLDTALLFSFLNLSKKKNSVNVNLLFMDEVLDQSLDQTGIDGIMSIFNEMKTMGYSIFVVSHREGVQENFDYTIEVEKRKFSEIKFA